MISVLENDNRKAFNVITHDSVLIFQHTDQLVPCAARIRAQTDSDDDSAVLNAYNTIMDEYPPDNSKIAVVLAHNAAAGERVAAQLIGGEYCRKVYVVPDEVSFLHQYEFLINMSLSDFPNYPSEITESLYLGGIGSLHSRPLAHLGITAVVSVIQHKVDTPDGISSHAIFAIEDECDENIASHFDDAIAFIDAAIGRSQKVLIHCHQGVSRSVSILIAYMVHAGLSVSVEAALEHVRTQRPQARPNPAFMAQLLLWEEGRA